MATTSSHNKKSSSVKRILSEARELSSDTCSLYTAHPLEDNIFEWHFTLRGPPSTEFCSGLYHGRILLPAEYPFRPPDLMLLTPNGRWELNKKICLTFTGFHEEMWQPAWGIRTALLGLQTFMTAKQEAAVGIDLTSLDHTHHSNKSFFNLIYSNPTISRTCLPNRCQPEENLDNTTETCLDR
uniref:Probable UBC6-E2 ubiquitin-conjugating enzyme n=1 Tax=Melanopsichium pennsylvanicum 4 TaxID=1398559 RepID=A0A077R3C1_9BASI|nr:probable UBC6-E2 ubiquitin-conjugating enzyme [Melanopsichium pennsylvanicum 4]